MKVNQGDKPGDGHGGCSDTDIVEGLKELQHFVSVLLGDRHRQQFGVEHIVETDAVIAHFLDMCAQLLWGDGTDAFGRTQVTHGAQRKTSIDLIYSPLGCCNRILQLNQIVDIRIVVNIRCANLDL